MTTREFFLQRWAEEYPMFRKALRALPQEKPDFRPHPRSRSALELVWLLVLEMQGCVEWAAGKDVSWKETVPPGMNLEKAVAAYEAAAQEFAARLDSLSEDDWRRKVKLIVSGDSHTYELLTGEMLWAALFDAIHHRGQLTLYLRLNGGKVPPIYGPSADEK